PNQPCGDDSRDVCRRTGWPDRLIAAAAGTQAGMITRRELFDLGVTPAMVDNAVARGRLIPVHRGVYAVGHSSLPPLAPVMAAVLAVGQGALVSHWSAAALWGLAPAADGEIDVTVVARDAGRRRRGIRVHRTDVLDPSDATTYHHIPVVSAARALLDITPDLTPPRLERTFDAALKEGRLTRHAVAQTAARNARRCGAGRLAALARAELPVTPDTRSRPEEDFLRLVRAGGLPDPEMNAVVCGYVVDALWRRPRLVVEIDGYAFHGTRRSFERDHERDQALTEAGFAVMRFTRDQIVTQPERVLVLLTRRLGELEAQSGRSSRIVS
ncbi:MAG TPA: DUF559 domain-containing protein, partial [Solirubrobacteraceae bacterium]